MDIFVAGFNVCEPDTMNGESRVIAWLTNISNCQVDMLPFDIMFSYEMSKLFLWRNGTTSESQCTSVAQLSCIASNVMRFELILDHENCLITMNSKLVAVIVGAIQRPTCRNINQGLFDMHVCISVYVLLDI